MKRTMEDIQGDLADVVGATAVIPTSHFVPSNNPSQYPPDPAEDFGDPFTFLGDPLLHNPDPPIQPGIFRIGNHETKRPHPPSNFDGSPRVLKAPPHPPTTTLLSNNLISSSNIGCVVQRSGTGLQIPSPRNTAIKRRKSQAKKVVCIPAVAPANSKSSGEIVPSDLWAWRKYGQKPIKGSPYPRGYYRCSGSKGCSARKQVERSRTDPNMLVITYTSEHNHPLPTQRNALAGSTRSHPSKNCVSKNPLQKQDNNLKEQETEIELNHKMDSDSMKVEEMDHDFDSRLEMDEAYFEEVGFAADKFEDSFFAELGEIDQDQLGLVFMQGLCGDGDGREDGGLGTFGGFYNWATNDDATISTGSTTTSTSYVEVGNDLLKYDPKPD